MKNPPAPTSLYWLGDREDADKTRHATDMRGCVMYFERQSDCLEFMRWVERLNSSEPKVGRNRTMLSCPKCSSYRISGPRYVKHTNGWECLRFTCNICGFEKDTETNDALNSSLAKDTP